MSGALYNSTILRLAASIPHHALLADPHGQAEQRSPICGSRVTVTLRLDAEGRIVALGQEVRACALGQASAAVMGGHAVGRDAGEIAAARDALAAYLAGAREDVGDWPGIEVFAPARPHAGAHARILLPFEAALAAIHAAHAAAAA